MAPESPPHRLFKFRFLFLAGYLLMWATVVYQWLIIGNLELVPLLVGTGIIVMLQLLYLAGAPHLRPHRPLGGRPMIVSLAVGGLVAGALTAGIFATLLSLVRYGSRDLSNMLLGLTLVAWVAWFWIFVIFLVGEWTDRYRKLYRFLLAGTMLELIITIPVDVSVRRRTQCYCEEGTFWALFVGIASMLWILGPGIVLLFLARRMQRRERFGYCRRCGYDLRMLATPRCPECGTPFELPAHTKAPTT